MKNKVRVMGWDIQLSLLVSVAAEVKSDSGRVIDCVLIPLGRHVSGSARDQ